MKPASVLTGLLAAGGFYLLLIDTASPPELYAGAGVTLLATGCYLLARDPRGEAKLQPGLLVKMLLRAVANVPQQGAMVLLELARQLSHPLPARGRLAVAAFDAGLEDAPARGRCALLEALGSFAPNSIIVGIDRERNLVLLHQLHHRPVKHDLPIGEP